MGWLCQGTPIHRYTFISPLSHGAGPNVQDPSMAVCYECCLPGMSSLARLALHLLTPLFQPDIFKYLPLLAARLGLEQKHTRRRQQVCEDLRTCVYDMDKGQDSHVLPCSLEQQRPCTVPPGPALPNFCKGGLSGRHLPS